MRMWKFYGWPLGEQDGYIQSKRDRESNYSTNGLAVATLCHMTQATFVSMFPLSLQIDDANAVAFWGRMTIK